MDRFESMEAFVAVVEAGGFSAASRRLGMPLASVSRKVSELEGELGVALLVRSTRKVETTVAGREFYAACGRILGDLGDAWRAASGEYSAPRGDLVMTAPIVFGRLHVLPIVIEFLEAYPEVNVALVLADRVVNLVEEHVDLALRIGDLEDSSLVATRVGRIGRVVCASRAYLERRGTPRHPDDLAAHDGITFVGIAGTWTFRIGTAERKVPVRTRLTVTTAEAAVDAAIAGVGLTRVLSYQAEAAVADGRLAVVLREFEPEPSAVSLVHPGGRLMPLKVRACLDFAAPRLKARLHGLAGRLVPQT